MLSLKTEVGKQAGPYREKVSAEKIAEFCKALGVPALNHAPPTFLTVFRRGEFELFKKLGLDLSNVLHAEQEYQYESALEAGDEVEFKTALIQVLEKQTPKASLQFLSFETEIHTEKGKIGKAITQVVIRRAL